jgi:hypothetical protein
MDLLCGAEAAFHIRAVCFQFNVLLSNYLDSVASDWKGKGYAVAQLVEALRHNPEGRGFDSRWCHWKFFIDNNPSDLTVAPLGSTQPLTEMSTRSISLG